MKRWAKKIRGRVHYFGPWDDPEAALDKYLEQKDDLHAGRTPRADAESLKLKDIANQYLNYKKALTDVGELSPCTWRNAKEATDLLVERFGKTRLVTDLRQEAATGNVAG
jgi:hypothetical protein